MNSKLVIFCACLALATAAVIPRNPVDLREAIETDDAEQLRLLRSVLKLETSAFGRSKRQLKLTGGGSLGSGVQIDAGYTRRLWTSGNQRHTIDGIGSYSQHLGGPNGNSKPDWQVGVGYGFRF